MFTRRSARIIFNRPSAGTRRVSTQKGPHVPLRHGFIQDAWLCSKVAAAAMIGSHIFNEYLYSWDFTWGISMLPNLAANGDSVILSKYYRRGRGVVVGDLVTFVHPIDPESRALKRVIGMPGDFVLRDSPFEGGQLMIQVPVGHCYVAGDNVTFSRDSRLYGPLPLALIRGKAVCKVTREGGWLPRARPIGGGLEEPLEFEDDELD